jgi:chemotaxis protein CheD
VDVDVVLGPGELFFGPAPQRIRTLLGSCVSFTVWHPAARVGGMCHYLLPTRPNTLRPAGQLDGRYADEALTVFLAEMHRLGTDPQEYQVKVFGGGAQLPRTAHGKGIDVPRRNVEEGLALLAARGLTVTARQVGGSGPRQVCLDLATGDVWVAHAGSGVGRAEADR